MSSIFAKGYSFLIPNFEVGEADRLPKKVAKDTRIHEVFLSFRGKDTRASFTAHLYAALRNAGILAFKDDTSLLRGDHISPALLKAIQVSEISVVVFSTNYATSAWCMQELETIMKCHRNTGQVVVPVFYYVDPSEVRHQTGGFGSAFRSLERRILAEENEVSLRMSMFKRKFNLQNWKEALAEAAGISGVVVEYARDENEAIKNIVENVIRLLDKTELFVADNQVGVECRIQDIIQLLDLETPNNVLLLGMWGMGGIGKTTIAKAVYNRIGRNFEGKSFLAHIREVWAKDTGQVHLQEQLLSDMNKGTTTKIQNVELGKKILKERLYHKKVLLILDDVNKLQQLNVLCGSREWFGLGSRIIITTRDMHILRGRRVDKVYTMKGMDEGEFIELFSWHAFKQASPREEFMELSRSVISYSGGLPLALEVLGCYLFDMQIKEWESALKKLKKIPNDEVQEKLKISYDGLSDDTEKEIFLDIACFFIGMDRNDVIHILNGCGLCAENGIRVLVERSLVTVDAKNKLGMHDLVRDMGREIIRAESPKEPEMRSRLWFHEDVLDVLSKETGTKAIEGLTLNLPKTNTQCLSTEAFKEMKKLRLLQLVGVQLDGDFKHLSKYLTWLCWHEFPLACIPANFYQRSLVSIELERSNVTHLWEKAQIDKLEEDMEQMESLTTLIADKTTIKTMPLSIVRSKSIRYISLCGYEGYSCDVFPSIIWSSVSPTNTLSSRVQTFASKPFLVSSDVLKTSSSHLLCTSKDLPKLQSLVIEFESEIRLFQDARSILDALCATKFEELESTTSQMHDMNDLTLIGCSRQVDMPESKRSLRSLLIQMGRSSQVTSILKQKISQNMSTSEWDDCLFPNDSYPDWLTFGNEGSSVVFEVPRVNQRTLQTIMFHIHYSSPDNITSDGLKNLLVINHTKTTIQLYKKDALISFKDEEWQRVLPNIEPGNKVEVAVFCGSRLTVSKTIVYLIYESMDEKL